MLVGCRRFVLVKDACRLQKACLCAPDFFGARPEIGSVVRATRSGWWVNVGLTFGKPSLGRWRGTSCELLALKCEIRWAARIGRFLLWCFGPGRLSPELLGRDYNGVAGLQKAWSDAQLASKVSTLLLCVNRRSSLQQAYEPHPCTMATQRALMSTERPPASKLMRYCMR
jgi:hypothetical protein